MEAGEEEFVASGWVELAAIQVSAKWFPISRVMGGRGRNRPGVEATVDSFSTVGENTFKHVIADIVGPDRKTSAIARGSVPPGSRQTNSKSESDKRRRLSAKN